MKVLKVFFSPYPWDVRVEKICRGLVAGGHEVTLLCRNERLQPADEVIDGFRVTRIRPPRIGAPAFNQWWNAPLPVNPVWWAHIAAALARERPDVVLIRDIPLAVPSAALARACGIPTVLDMAENYPAAMAEWRRWERGGATRALTRNVAAARALERASVRAVNHVVVVAEEQRSRLVAMKVPPRRVWLASNTPELDRASRIDRGLQQELRQRFRGRTVMLYVGELHLHRGIDTAIRAVSRVRAQLDDPLLLLVGKGIHERLLRRIAASQGGQELVHFEGWVRPELVASYVASCDIALVPHRASEHTNTTLPNKLFDYMAHGKPVVVSDAAPMARIVNAEGCGTVFRSGDGDSLARAILHAADPTRGPRMGLRGRQAVLREYNWDVDFRRLCSALETAAAGARKRCGRASRAGPGVGRAGRSGAHADS